MTPAYRLPRSLICLASLLLGCASSQESAEPYVPPVDAEEGLCTAPLYTTALPAAASAGPCGVGAGVVTPSPGPVGEAEATAPFTVGPYTWTVHRNLTYGVRGGRVLQGDLWVPQWTTTRAPGLILGIHGGGWEACDRRRADPSVELFLLRLSVASNAAFFNVEYRLSQEGGGFPENLRDVRCAAQFIAARTRNRPALGVDGARLVAVGESAGAHLASMLALTQARGDLDPGCTDGSLPPPRADFLAAFAFSPVTDLPALVASQSLAREAPQHYTGGACDEAAPEDVRACGGCPSTQRCIDASPLRHACELPETTKLFLVHAPRSTAKGEYDFLIPLSQSLALHDAVKLSRPEGVQLWAPEAAAIEAAGCYSQLDIVSAGGTLPDGRPMPFAHGFMPCLYEPLLPLLGPAVASYVGGQ